jgi:hypothetical protein
MARKRKKKKLSAVSLVKALARERVGRPRSGQVVPDGKKRVAGSEKHKPTLGELLQEND